MPLYRVFLTDLVTGAFDIDAPTPEAAADEVREHGSDEGTFVDAETWSIEVCGTDDNGNAVLEPPLHIWSRVARSCACGCHDCNCTHQAPCRVCGQPGCQDVCVDKPLYLQKGPVEGGGSDG